MQVRKHSLALAVCSGAEMISTLESGSVFDSKYQIESTLGSGAVGTVYRALEVDLNRPVAIKVLHIWNGSLDQEESIRRFKREAKVLCQLLHPNILRVYRFGMNESSLPFLVMEYVQGESLKDLIVRTGALSYQVTLKIAIKLAEALLYAHENGIIHRDLKPENILVNMDQAEPVVKLIDFGLCKPDERISNTQQRTLTGTGNLIGTALYMAPEQVMGQQVDERSDIFSFACVLFEMLTGAPAFGDLSTGEILLKRINDPLPEILKMNPDSGLPPQLDRLIQDCSAKKQADRPQSFAPVIETLKSIKTAPGAGKFSPAKKGLFGLSRKTQFIILGTTALVSIVVGTLVMTGGISFVQSVSMPEDTINVSVNAVQSLLKEKQAGAAQNLANETTHTESFRSWPEAQQVSLYFKYFELFRDAGEQKAAQTYIANFFRTALPMLNKTKELPADWDSQIRAIYDYVKSQKLSKNAWRALDAALNGDKFAKVYLGNTVSKLLINELHEEAFLNSRASINRPDLSEYTKRMIFLAEAAGKMHQEAYFQRYMKIGLDLAKKHNMGRYEEVAYATWAEKELRDGNLDEAKKYMDMANNAYERVENTENEKDLKASARAGILRTNREIELLLAKRSLDSGDAAAAKAHQKKAIALENEALALDEVKEERSRYGLKKMVQGTFHEQ